ncbi:aspartate kinase [Nocardia wallacei]|uniref:aspartate kinase n=1 Tax=Nocardia wallacei TaxID=480035 RepID=UPI002455B449|nr:aspartate kinase [Nocardia wallacei]
MSLVVQKYGGTSLGDAHKIRHVARRVAATVRDRQPVVVVVSAMGGTTDTLLALARTLTDDPHPRERDLLLSTGEQTSAAALALALHELGTPARSFTGRDAGITTDGVHARAHITDIDPTALQECLATGIVPVVTGFQGVAADTDEITTLDRGGSDTTAVALAAALGAETCEIYTDVDGVHTADPRHVPGAPTITHLTYEDMSELAANGATVLAHTAVDYAARHHVSLHVRSSATDLDGTRIGTTTGPTRTVTDRHGTVIAVTHQTNQLRCRLVAVDPTALTTVFIALADTDLPLDMLTYRTGDTSNPPALQFTVHDHDHGPADHVLSTLARANGLDGHEWSGPIGKLTLVGHGLATPRVLSRALNVLRSHRITVEDLSVHPRRISITCPRDATHHALSHLHHAFFASDNIRTATPALATITRKQIAAAH